MTLPPRFALLTLSAACAQALAQSAPPAPVTTLPPVEVIGTSPVGGSQPRDRIPSNVQHLDAQRLRQLDSASLPDLLGRHLGSVNVNETQGNPFQVEVNFRGFTASPLLGAPQGLSVFVDGVRVNEPFGDVVNWDLIPKGAIASVTMMPGSNPLFGLNTLGGALVVKMKRGDTEPGTGIELGAGSFGRRSLELTHGGKLGERGHLFIAASHYREDGWRDFSPSKLEQLYLRTGQSDSHWSWDLALTHGRTNLIGNGLLPQTLLAARREQIYTRPDQTRNRMTMLSLNAEADIDTANSLAANLYLRRIRTGTLNGDLNDDYDPPDVEETGVENRTAARQRGHGGSLQWTRKTRGNQFLAGVSFDQASTRFEQTEAEGMLDATRAVVPEEDPEFDALITGRTRTRSLYASNTWSPTPALHLTVSGRYNDTRVETVDVGRATLGLDTTLDGQGHYKRFNPAFGASWQASPRVTVYGGVSQGNRAPSPIELGCSDPENACVLPNALQSDPPLRQVVSRTLEAGVRGRLGSEGQWNVSVFRTVNRDDLLFVSNSLAAGYFTNFGRTRRQGVEMSVSQRVGAIDYSAAYGLVDATFQSSACIVAESNSSAETSAVCTGDDEIEIRPGNRIPNIPKHTLKFDAGWTPVKGLRLGANVVAYSSQYARGNENNAHTPDGAEFNGSGRLPGFAVMNLDASWQFAPGWSLSAKLTNLFDRKYATGSLLGENAFDAAGVLQAPDDWRNEQFLAPAAPRALWVALRYRFGATGR